MHFRFTASYTSSLTLIILEDREKVKPRTQDTRLKIID